MAQKKYVSLSKLSVFLDNLKDVFSVVGHKHSINDFDNFTVDTELSPTSTNPVQNKVVDAEFEAMSVAMNALDLAIDNKADTDHNHDDTYYTETEIDDKLDSLTDVSVKLSAPYIITTNFGLYTIPSGQTSTQVGSAGQTLRSFLEGAFGADDETVWSSTKPSCSITMNGGSAEIGTTITPSASWSTSAGTYKWGTYANGAANFSDKTTGITYSKGTITIDKTSFILTGSTTVTASGSATRSAVTKYPCSKLGENLTDNLESEYKSSKTLSPTKTATFTGYRAFFYGAVKVNPSSTTLTSTIIRGLTNGGNYDGSKTFTIKANGATDLKAFIVAIPHDNTRGRINSVKSTAGMTVDMTESYPKATYTISVADARGGSTNTAAYDVYIWNPASIDSGTVHEFVLS